MGKKEIFLIFLFFILFSLDRLTKIFVKEKHINPGGFLGISLPFFYPLIFVIFLFFILIFFFFQKNFLVRVGIIFLLAGATSNFIDKILYSGIIDWIPLSLFNFNFTFNIADIYFWIGTFIFFFSIFSKKKKLKNEKKRKN